MQVKYRGRSDTAGQIKYKIGQIKVGQILQVKYKGRTKLAVQVKYKGFPEGIRSNIMVGQSLQVKYKGRLQVAARGGVLFFQCTLKFPG